MSPPSTTRLVLGSPLRCTLNTDTLSTKVESLEETVRASTTNVKRTVMSVESRTRFEFKIFIEVVTTVTFQPYIFYYTRVYSVFITQV